MSDGIEKLIINSKESKLDRKILMNLINYEEKDSEEIHIAIKQMTADKLDDTHDKSPFRKFLSVVKTNNNSFRNDKTDGKPDI